MGRKVNSPFTIWSGDTIGPTATSVPSLHWRHDNDINALTKTSLFPRGLQTVLAIWGDQSIAVFCWFSTEHRWYLVLLITGLCSQWIIGKRVTGWTLWCSGFGAAEVITALCSNVINITSAQWRCVPLIRHTGQEIGSGVWNVEHIKFQMFISDEIISRSGTSVFNSGIWQPCGWRWWSHHGYVWIKGWIDQWFDTELYVVGLIPVSAGRTSELMVQLFCFTGRQSIDCVFELRFTARWILTESGKQSVL